MKNKRKFSENLSAAAIMSVAASFLVALYIPLELYFYNQDEFWFDFSDLFPSLAGLFVVLFAANFILLNVVGFINRNVFYYFALAEAVIFLCSYIQGNYLVGNLPALDGTAVDWSNYIQDNLITLGMWIAIIVIVIVCVIRLGIAKTVKAAQWLSAGISLMLLITLLIVAISEDGFVQKVKATVSDENLFTMSEDKNFVIFLLDALDSTTFSEVLEEDEKLQEALADFTYYPNTMGVYPYTNRAVPFILSGEWFENTEDYREWAQRSYDSGALITMAQDAGYTLDLYEKELLTDSDGVFIYRNVLNESSLTSSYKLANLELKLSLFKLVPYLFKDRFLFDMSEFSTLQGTAGESNTYSSNDQTFYQKLQEDPVEYQEDASFKFIHVEGAHVPFNYDENLNTIEDGTYEDKVRACATMIKTYLQKLKDADVYDNSVIIIMADHGYSTSYRQTPVLMIKGYEESKQELTISNAPISYEDLQEAYENLFNGAAGNQVFSAEEGEERNRRYLYFKYLHEDWMTEYIQTGDAWDCETMVATGNEFNADDAYAGGVLDLDIESYEKSSTDPEIHIDESYEVSEGYYLNGWAVDSEGRVPETILVVNGDLTYETARAFRTDLEIAVNGRGMAGFTITLSEPISDTVTFYVIDEDGLISNPYTLELNLS